MSLACTLAVDPFNGRGLNLYLRSGYQVRGYLEHRAHLDGLEGWLRLVKPLRWTPPLRRKQALVRVDDAAGLRAVLAAGMVGFQMARHPGHDNRKNVLYFARAGV